MVIFRLRGRDPETDALPARRSLRLLPTVSECEQAKGEKTKRSGKCRFF